MALTASERTLLETIASDAKEAREASISAATLLTEHSKQLSRLFERTDFHADQITQIKIRQDECKQNNSPNLQAAKDHNKIALAAIAVALITAVVQVIQSV